MSRRSRDSRKAAAKNDSVEFMYNEQIDGVRSMSLGDAAAPGSRGSSSSPGPRGRYSPGSLQQSQGDVDGRHSVFVTKTKVGEEDFQKIEDNFTSIEEVSRAIQREGLETCNLIFGIDYTMSNRSQGQKTFNGKNLHMISDESLNPYQHVMCILGETLEPFDDDGIIPTFGFGDAKTKDKTIFPLKGEDGQCEGFNDVLDAYNEVTPKIRLGGPTNFAPLIEKAIEIVKETNEYHILVIVADGQVTNEGPTKQALIDASHYPISIIMVGVGDGPWGSMEHFDDGLTERKFDNFQFVNFHEVMTNAKNPQAAFALNALMEIPEQYKYLKDSGLVK